MTTGRSLRIAVLGDLDSIHTQRWLRAFAVRGHDMHAISFYRPKTELHGITLHVLREGVASTGKTRPATKLNLHSKVPASLMRPVHLMRYRRAGLKETVTRIAPDVLHAHYLVEYGFYGTAAAFRPYAVSAWGSDVYRDTHSAVTKTIARLVAGRADLVTGSDPAMVKALRRLGAKQERLSLVRIGALEELFFEEEPVSVNLEPGDTPPTVLSTRALEPLYGIDTVLRAFARARQHVPGARLQVAHDGSKRFALEGLASELNLGDSVSFLGRLTPEQVRDALSAAQVYVSVPSSDSMAASTMEAMARGSFPVVSDLASQDGFIDHGKTGLRVPPGDVDLLALALQRALVDAGLRRDAVGINRARVEADGRLSTQVEKLEAAFYGLVSPPGDP